MLSTYCKDRAFSNHYSVVLSSSQLSWGPIPFRSLDCSLTEPSFIKVFKKEWVQLTGLPFHRKLVKMREPLRKWNREIFGHIDQKIKSFQKEWAKVDLKAQEFLLDELEWHRMEALQSQLWLWQTQKERYWKQLSICKIIKESDRNTKYFHVLATIRRKKKMISSLTRGTEVIND